MIKIGITGTHGSEKSTLASRLAYCCRDAGKKVIVVDEVARSCAHPLRTIEAQEWIWAEQMRREKHAIVQDVDVIVCDRTVLDNLMYYRYIIEQSTSLEQWMPHWMRWWDLYRESMDWMPTYTQVISLPLNLEWIKAPDPLRPKSPEYAKRIDRLYDRFVDSYVTDTFI